MREKPGKKVVVTDAARAKAACFIEGNSRTLGDVQRNLLERSDLNGLRRFDKLLKALMAMVEKSQVDYTALQEGMQMLTELGDLEYQEALDHRVQARRKGEQHEWDRAKHRRASKICKRNSDICDLMRKDIVGLLGALGVPVRGFLRDGPEEGFAFGM